jgi:two-component system, NarL family, sensor histidine kinase UhpB
MIAFEEENIRHFTQKILQVQENERKNLARELHDEIGQYLTAIHIDASAILATKELQSARESASAIDIVALQMMDIVHNMLKRLKPSGFDNLGLEAALHELVDAWQNRTRDVIVDFQLDGEFSDINNSILIVIYRLIQESLTNISRHAEAKNVSIKLSRTRDHILLTIIDDGRGYDITEEYDGFGLVGMRERVEELDGRFKLQSRTGEGVSINVTLPISEKTRYD